MTSYGLQEPTHSVIYSDEDRVLQMFNRLHNDLLYGPSATAVYGPKTISTYFNSDGNQLLSMSTVTKPVWVTMVLVARLPYDARG
jgi:hypothetical protein